ncbi:glycogen synthase GlgA [Allorhizobium taibaishanense]|uniref:Glycogen synthase n=1 Tax=Allorhizobium taibaishanense TaxID=887144 RepID=A0A1Q9A512_9HYPH|nr:glycogen synthase GlgA [Allorhizobium taibaishanense]MBB4006741.1 starch synthase [Allorhizobium taibaishanense]OLP49641.1 starch synthase [Allorhizobium taibaishanense]
MNILSVASEVYPLVKTGGLADVAGALPLALEPLGVKTKTLLPGYPAVMAKLDETKALLDLDLLGEPARVLAAQHQGLDLLILDAPSLYDRPGGPYVDGQGRDFDDNWKRFAALSLAGARIAQGALTGWKPDLVHVHDWQAALVPVYMRYDDAPEIPSLITIHNIAFQGQFSAGLLPDLGLPEHALWEALEYYGTLAYLKGGVVAAHAISTVSPSYAEEILDPHFGMGMEGLIASRAQDLYGIVNGIDTHVWDPAADALIAAPYSAATLRKRQANREALSKHFGLDDDAAPIFCVISRLTWQKGMDVLAEVCDDLVAAGGKLVILGSGDPDLEQALQAAAQRHPGRIGMVMGYNEPLSHLMQAGADAILIPSRFEPCGLTQLYGLRYGCVPVVSRTGGLNDTVIDANAAALAAKAATGIQFAPVTGAGLRQAVRRAIRLFDDKKLWYQIQKQGMKADVSWGASAQSYVDVYNRLLGKG